MSILILFLAFLRASAPLRDAHFMVPEGGIEPPLSQGQLDFETRTLSFLTSSYYCNPLETLCFIFQAFSDFLLFLAILERFSHTDSHTEIALIEHVITGFYDYES